MKKKGFIGRLAAVAVVLCLITMSLTSGTLAKYASEASGNATATVAKWKIAFTDGADTTPQTLSSNFTLDLTDTALADGMVAANRIAPGTKGSFKLGVDGTGTEVAFTYTIELNLTGIKDKSDQAVASIPLKFYTDEACTKEINDTTNKVTGSVTVGGTATSSSTVYWKWVSTDDTTDTEYGTDSAADQIVYKIPVTITAEQNITEKTT